MLSKESLDRFKEIFKKEYGKDLTDAEASESAHNLVNFFQALWDISIKEVERERRLKKEPDGFPVDGHYSCRICRCAINPETGWYDKWGQKCFPCTEAVKNGTVPTFACINDESYYKTWQLKDRFNIHPQTARKMVRTGELIARTITAKEGGIHEYIFLKKENPHLVDPPNPIRKAWLRHRDKENDRKSREWKLEIKRKKLLK